jgi:hypothetical protein
MYGRIHYENESGESGTVNLTVRVVDCETRADYERELEDGCRWVESARNEFRNLWGEILGCQNCGGDGVDPGSLRTAEPCPPCKGEGSVFASMRRDEAISLFNQMEERRGHREAFGI